VTPRFDPAEAEPRWLDAWLRSGALRGDPGSPRPPYVIAVPPPNVTGSLHMGHALNGTIQDVLIRWHRMAGYETEWICGTDHAGIATQAIVERHLAQQGLSRHQLGREEFERRVWEWRRRYGGQIIEQFKRLGCTLDYARERFTMDEGYALAVRRVFVDLYQKGYLYRDRYMVNWDPGLQSAISDLEVDNREVTDTLVRIAYPLADGSGEVVVATVRPETMLGDTAVAVNPSDERYRHLVGRTCLLPLAGREIPIIADEHVDPSFGTGALKITPAHDPNDFEIARRHGLPEVSVIGEDGLMTPLAGEPYAGLTPGQCARRVLEDLRAQGLLRGEEPYTHTVPFSHRSGERVQPLLSMQWFCDMEQLAQPAIAAVREGRVRFFPAEPHTRVYLDWMERIRPWCVSRQLWWGHQLPVWYRDGETYVGLEPPAGEGWQRDEDVLDTWFSSALWPFATLGWPQDTPELRRFYPTTVLSTARDIIFLWVARMIMTGIEYMGEPPFRDVYVHSVIQAPDGRRMSKSLGTGIDPLDLIAVHGADAVRFGLLLMASQQDVRFNEERIRQGRQLATKLWNATRLVVERGGAVQAEAPEPALLADRWICSRVAAAVKEASELVAAYELSRLADLVYHVIFDDFCDWYLELLKVGEATPAVAGHVLEQLLALAHPLIPFVTEECWSRLPGSQGLMLTHALARAPGPSDPVAERAVAALREAVTELRAFRAEAGVPPRETLEVALDVSGPVPFPTAELAALARVRVSADGYGTPQVVPLSFGRLLVRRAGAEVDAETERARLSGAIEELEREIARAAGMLANPRFVERAPADVVGRERDKLARFTAERETLLRRLEALGG
jgi:valyl-tRNA synthetase